MTSKCGENKSNTLSVAECVTDVIQTPNFCRVEFLSCIMYPLIMSKFGPAKEKEDEEDKCQMRSAQPTSLQGKVGVLTRAQKTKWKYSSICK